MSETHEHHIVPVRTYVNVLLVLLGLTVLTVVASLIDFGQLHTFVALLIATIKAGFVAAIFMNLKYSSKLHLACLILAVLFLILLYTISNIDIITRVPVMNTL